MITDMSLDCSEDEIENEDWFVFSKRISKNID